MSNNKKQFKNSTAYKIIVGILLVLYIGYQLFSGGSENTQDDASGTEEYSQEQYVESSENSVSYETSEPTEKVETVQTETETVVPEEITVEDVVIEVSEEITVPVTYTFRSDNLWESHYDKHGIDMGFADKEEYLQAANAVIANPGTLHKIEGEDGDDVYYLEETNEFVVVSTDGYLRTYFLPDDGIDYYNRQ